MSDATFASVDAITSKKSNQYYGAFIGSLGGCAVGASLGWSSSANEVLGDNRNITAAEIGLASSVLNAGASAGALLVPFVIKRVSRLRTMLLAVPVFLLGWAFICLADHKVSLLIIGRLICGLCSGTFCVLTPLYVAEIADESSRDRLLTLFQLLINCGIMYVFVLGHALSGYETVWRYSLISCAACLPVLLVNLLPESPFYYLTNANEIDAKSALTWYRHDLRVIEEEMSELKALAELKHSKPIVLSIVKNRRVIRPLAACFGVILIQQLCGVNAMIFYALSIMNAAGSGDLTGSEQTLVVGTVQIFASLLATILINALGRRILLTVSCALMGLFLILLGWFFNLREEDPEYDDIYFWMPPTWMALFFAAYNIGVGPISWSLLGDTFPFEIRMAAAAAGASFSWLISLISALTFSEMAIGLGVPKLLWLFAGFCWLGAVFCAVMVTDNRNKRLREIQADFHIEHSESNDAL